MSTTTIDHEEIRAWVESKGGKPAAVDRTHEGGEVGLIRLMFPKSKQSEHSSLVEISWDEFFEQFDKAQLALIYQEDTLFNKLVGRDTVEKREHGDHGSRHHPDPKHKSESSQAPSHEPASGGKAPNRSDGDSRRASDKDDNDLKSREYKDADGNVHHHTRAYQEVHATK